MHSHSCTKPRAPAAPPAAKSGGAGDGKQPSRKEAPLLLSNRTGTRPQDGSPTPVPGSVSPAMGALLG